MRSQTTLQRVSALICLIQMVIAQSAPTSSFDPNYAACTSYSAIQSSCAAAVSSFAALPFSQEASCLCYTSTSTWAPNFYDGLYGSCINYYQTASPSIYSSSFTGAEATRTPCAAAGNVRGESAVTGPASVNIASSSAMATSAASSTAAASASATSASSGNAAVVVGGGALFAAFAGFAVLL